jgi:uncharacterized membrane protein
VAEAALMKREGDAIRVVDSFDAAGVTSDDTATGIVVGSLVGILGGPMGVLLGASVGALAGSVHDANDAVNSASMLEATAVKLYDNEAAVIALVQEEEPAFDAAFEGIDVTIIRQFAADVYDEVERAREVEADLANQAKERMRAEKKEARKERRDDRKASIAARFDSMKEKRAERKAERKADREAKKEMFSEAAEIANAEYVNSTKEMMGEA